ncbi:YigZ family protein [Endozoicomonas sp. 4G]|nr:YigZ family protein [Endozoicomonas sp. 4G]
MPPIIASHHCLAYIAGPPEGNTVLGFADDGEPGGTAGKPMLKRLASLC